MNIIIASRHQASIDWVKTQINQTNQTECSILITDSLNTEMVQKNDVIIGNLPLSMIADIIEKHAFYWHLEMHKPRNMNGVELSAVQLQEYNLSLQEYYVIRK